MAVHRRDTRCLEGHLKQDVQLISRAFNETEIFPDGFENKRPSPYAYVTPMTDGVTLLHMAVEFCDLEMAAWLLQYGADINAESAVDVHGYGGWTPLFRAMATLHVPRSFPDLASLLLDRGADVTVRASIRKPVADDNDERGIRENVTPIEYAQSFVEADLVNQEALKLVREAVSCVRSTRRRLVESVITMADLPSSPCR